MHIFCKLILYAGINESNAPDKPVNPSAQLKHSDLESEISQKLVYKQVGLIIYKMKKSGPRVLLITSRETGRWVIPKGWPMKGKPDSKAALQEAWEEAGLAKIKGSVERIGTYFYEKAYRKSKNKPVFVKTYLAEAKTFKTKFPEAGQRKLKWVKPKRAAKMVKEPSLRQTFKDLAKNKL